jgi:AcrR family transcriptional regulator
MDLKGDSMGKRDDILISALKIVTKEGIQSLTMAKIQKEAGVGFGTMYNYFPGKEALLHVLYENAMDRMNDEIMTDFALTGNVRIDFDELMLRFLDYSIAFFDQFNFTDQYSFFIRDEFSKSYADKPNPLFQAAEQIIVSGKKQKLVKDMEVSVLQRIVSGVIIAVSQSFYLNDFMPSDKLKKNIVTACWDAIKA